MYIHPLEPVLATSEIHALQELNVNDYHEEKLIWTFQDNGEFTVKSAYRELRSRGQEITELSKETMESLRHHAKYQRRMFDQVVQLVRPGGVIVYSTFKS
ncbi:hypothetical protein OROMI_027761 [Orobanche minor]